MKPYARILALLLALFMVSMTFLACAKPTEDTPDDPDETIGEGDDIGEGDSSGEGEKEDERIKPDIPETADFGEAEISFLYWYVEAWVDTVRYCRDIYSESPIGDPILDTVYYRNAEIEENYNVIISLEMRQQSEIANLVNQMNASGDSTYLVVVPRLLEQANLVTGNAFHNLYDVEYIDFSKPWWDQDSIEQLSSNGTLNLVASSMLVNDKDATAALAFSKDAAADNELDSLYEYVDNNEWTWATLSELAELTTKELDGDGVMTVDDFWGFLGKNDVMTSFFHGSGGKFVVKDEADDTFVFNFGSETDIYATEDLIDLMTSDFFFNHHMEGIDDDVYTDMFETGHGLFFWMRLDEVTNMRGSSTNFGILPIPKYDEYQENYYSTVSQHTTGLISIPLSTSGEDLSMVGMILEALSAHSHYDLQSEYIDISLKGRGSRDDESKPMLDIILNSRVFDPGCIFGFGSFASDYQNMVQNGNTGVASFLESMKEATETAIEEFNENLMNQ